MVYRNILFAQADGVATITLNRDDTRNALAWETADEIAHALDRLGPARVLVLTAAGRAFCSGGDMASPMAEGQSFGDMLNDGITGSVNPMLTRLRALDIPVICAVNGAAAGAGASLALAADFVIAADSAFFCFAFPNMGLAVDAGASWMLPRLVGMARATEALMLAERISAAQAAEWGMIHKCVPAERLPDETAALAARLAAGPTRAYGLIRQTLHAAAQESFTAALAREAEAQRISGNSADCAEAISAFFAKRKPAFSGT